MSHKDILVLIVCFAPLVFFIAFWRKLKGDQKKKTDSQKAGSAKPDSDKPPEQVRFERLLKKHMVCQLARLYYFRRSNPQINRWFCQRLLKNEVRAALRCAQASDNESQLKYYTNQAMDNLAIITSPVFVARYKQFVDQLRKPAVLSPVLSQASPPAVLPAAALPMAPEARGQVQPRLPVAVSVIARTQSSLERSPLELVGQH